MKQSKYRGVHWNRRDGNWRVFIKHNSTRINLGTFPPEQEEAAGRKYNEWALKLNGAQFATLNYFENEYDGENTNG